MADQVQNEAPVADATTQLYAVVQTGIITDEADIVVFKDDKGRRVPSIIGLYPTKEKANAMKRRLHVRFSRVLAFQNPDWFKSTPVFGVALVNVPAKKPRTKKGEETAPAATTNKRTRR